jgi:Sec-independent protein secretion pathway component TatC
VAWDARELSRRVLLGLAGALPVFIVSWMLRVKILQFLVLPTFYALADDMPGASDFPLESAHYIRSFPGLMVHLNESFPLMFRKAALAGGLVLSAPWTAYQAWSYVASRAKPGGAGRIRSFVTASTAVVWGSAWLVPNLLVPALPLSWPYVDRATELMLDEDGYDKLVIHALLDFVCASLLTVCVAALVPIVVAFVISATRASWGRLLRFGGLCVLLVAAGIAALLRPLGVPAIWGLCGLGSVYGSVYCASVAVAYLLVRGRRPESSD